MFLRSALVFVVLLLLSQTGCHSEQAQPAEIPAPPGQMSPGAQAFYAAGPMPVVGLDLSDINTVKSVRADIDVAWRVGLSTLKLAPIESISEYAGVTVNHIRFPNTRDDGRTIVYLHGGGFVVGSAKANIVLPSRVSQATQIPVISIDYRMPPEYPFPAALDDALAVVRALLADGQDPKKLLLLGESAGGGLVLSTVIKMRQLDLPMPAGLVVLSPWADLSNTGDSSLTLNDYDPVISWPKSLASAAAAYAGGQDASNALISPVFGDYSGLPPMLVQAGSREVLLSDAFRVVRRARRADVDVQFDVWDGMWHVFQQHTSALEADEAVAEIADYATRVTDQ